MEQEGFITKDKIRNTIKEMKKGKSPRGDEIQWILKKLAESVCYDKYCRSAMLRMEMK